MTPMSVERRRVVAAMKALGWTPTRKEGGLWEFRRPDTNGWFDVIKVKQANLNWELVMKYDENFQQIIRKLWAETVRHRYTALFMEFPDEEETDNQG